MSYIHPLVCLLACMFWQNSGKCWWPTRSDQVTSKYYSSGKTWTRQDLNLNFLANSKRQPNKDGVYCSATKKKAYQPSIHIWLLKSEEIIPFQQSPQDKYNYHHHCGCAVVVYTHLTIFEIISGSCASLEAPTRQPSPARPPIRPPKKQTEQDS